jgi:hypothetical protein
VKRPGTVVDVLDELEVGVVVETELVLELLLELGVVLLLELLLLELLLELEIVDDVDELYGPAAAGIAAQSSAIPAASVDL